MGHWYAAITADGKDTVLGAERTLNELGKSLGYGTHAINYYYNNNIVCKKLNAKIIRLED